RGYSSGGATHAPVMTCDSSTAVPAFRGCPLGSSQGGRMPLAEASGITGGDKGLVAGMLVIALAARGFAYVLIREVTAAGQGTPKMQDIARAVQEGARAYLNRQFRTLAVFAAVVFVVMLLLPVNEGGASVRIGRAIFFLVGAAFSAAVGFIGMTPATHANVRVARAGREPGRGGRAGFPPGLPTRASLRRHDAR